MKIVNVKLVPAMLPATVPIVHAAASAASKKAGPPASGSSLFFTCHQEFTGNIRKRNKNEKRQKTEY